MTKKNYLDSLSPKFSSLASRSDLFECMKQHYPPVRQCNVDDLCQIRIQGGCFALFKTFL